MAIYRLIGPLAAFAPKDNHALNIPKGSLVKKDSYLPAKGLTDLGWGRKTVMVAVQDFLQVIEPFAELE
jgi:hypothetical protein